MTCSEPRTDDIELLNVFLSRERSAYEAYALCLESICDLQLSLALTRLRNCHSARVQALDQYIRTLGGLPREHSSMWRILSRATHERPGSLDRRTMILALEQYSSRTLRAYRNSLRVLSPETRSFIVREILPERQQEHSSVVSLQEAV